MADSFSNRICISRTNKDQNGNLHLHGTFCGSLSFPREGDEKPFSLVERKTRNDKTYKQVKCTLVIVPDNRKSEKGYPTSGIYLDGNYLTFQEVLNNVGAELFNGKLYATVYMDRNTMGLYQLMADPNLSYKDNIMVAGDLSFLKGSNDGKVRAAIGNVSLFARDHIFDDKVDKANANCQLSDKTGGNDGGSAPASQNSAGGSAPAYPSSNSAGFVEIDDDDWDLPF